MPFQSPAGYSLNRQAPSTGAGPSSEVRLSALLLLFCGFSVHEQETRTLNMICKRSSIRATRLGHLHGWQHPDCEEEDTVCPPEQMPPSDSSRLRVSLSLGKGKSHLVLVPCVKPQTHCDHK